MLVLTIAVARGYFPPELAWTVALTNAPGEIIVATIITTGVVLAVAGREAKRRSTV